MNRTTQKLLLVALAPLAAATLAHAAPLSRDPGCTDTVVQCKPASATVLTAKAGRGKWAVRTNSGAPATVYLNHAVTATAGFNPVQAGKREILGRRVYADLLEAAEHHRRPIEIVDVFRPSDEVPQIAEQAIEIGARVLWCQLGVINEEAAERARKAGLAVVMDRCCKIEHARFFGGLRTIGLNTGVVTSRLSMQT